MKKFFVALFFLFALTLSGCLPSGGNYDSQTDQSVPEKDLATWVGHPLPQDYSSLKYQILGGGIDKQVFISFNTSESFFETIKAESIPYSEAQQASASGDFYFIDPEQFSRIDDTVVDRPESVDKVYLSKEGHYRKYVWYQNGRFNLLYVSF